MYCRHKPLGLASNCSNLQRPTTLCLYTLSHWEIKKRQILPCFLHFHPMAVAVINTTIIVPSHLSARVVLERCIFSMLKLGGTRKKKKKKILSGGVYGVPLLPVKNVDTPSAHVGPRMRKRSISTQDRAISRYL